MGLDLVIETDESSIDRNLNDFIHSRQCAESDGGSSYRDYSDNEWFVKLLHPDKNPAMRAVDIALSYKNKCDSVLSKVGLLKPKLEVDGDTGQRLACGGMEGTFSGFAKIEVAAAAGCPSCNILREGVRRYIQINVRCRARS
ncbi:hypothetical protein RRF57_012648 [Xylaria bambusicola]|uniref:Uncharacterized protein n=1 Tax=Xylaria bambusicola TaxID=326684 RepID=A0AAN7ZDU0_9PEZI